jgi:hypothetical protein
VSAGARGVSEVVEPGCVPATLSRTLSKKQLKQLRQQQQQPPPPTLHPIPSQQQQQQQTEQSVGDKGTAVVGGGKSKRKQRWVDDEYLTDVIRIADSATPRTPPLAPSQPPSLLARPTSLSPSRERERRAPANKLSRTLVRSTAAGSGSTTGSLLQQTLTTGNSGSDGALSARNSSRSSHGDAGALGSGPGITGGALTAMLKRSFSEWRSPKPAVLAEAIAHTSASSGARQGHGRSNRSVTIGTVRVQVTRALHPPPLLCACCAVTSARFGSDERHDLLPVCRCAAWLHHHHHDGRLTVCLLSCYLLSVVCCPCVCCLSVVCMSAACFLLSVVCRPHVC